MSFETIISFSRTSIRKILLFLKRYGVHILFAVTMFTFPAITLRLFYMALRIAATPAGSLPPSAAPPLSDDAWKLQVMYLMITVVGVPFFLFIAELFRHGRQNQEQREPLLELSVHAVPYGILSLSMLFEYKKVKEGESEGLVALASIMIIFILSELGLFMYTNIRRAKQVSSALEQRIDAMRVILTGLPWVNYFLELTEAASSESTVVTEIEKLLSEWASLISKRKDQSRVKALLNIFLRLYVREEICDLKGEVREVPPMVIPPIDEKGGRVSYFATNIGLYSAFVEGSVEYLAKQAIPGRIVAENAPCLAVITNALPSQFWVWPRDDKEGEIYGPIINYLKAQVAGAKDNGLKIFRTILVGESVESIAQADPLKRNASMPILWDKAEWKRQLEWKFIVDKSGVPLTSQQTPCQNQTSIPILEWTKLDCTTGNRHSFWVVPEERQGGYFGYKNVWRHYCEQIHWTGSRAIGRTEVFAIDEKVFTGSLKEGKGFGGCPDLLFLGTCPMKEENVWDEASKAVWSLALMTTMSTQTGTMFLTLIHEPDAIASVWENVRTARSRLPRPLPPTSDDEIEKAKAEGELKERLGSLS